MASWRKKMDALAKLDGEPDPAPAPHAVIDDLASNDAMLTCDSGTIATWAARHFTIRGEREFFLSGNLATMAPGLPYAIAAQWAHPGRQCIAFVGDGGFAMLMAEFATACRYELPIKVVINNNASLGQIMWEQTRARLPGVRRPFRTPTETSPRGRKPVEDLGPSRQVGDLARRRPKPSPTTALPSSM